jgi:hypothetical protein
MEEMHANYERMLQEQAEQAEDMLTRKLAILSRDNLARMEKASAISITSIIITIIYVDLQGSGRFESGPSNGNDETGE